jgi:Holliday junction resolvase RusA-like endonuclease
VNKYIVEIPGKPIPLARARATARGFYDSQYEAKKNFASYVKENIYLSDNPTDKPIKIEVDFLFKMPKSWSKKKRKEHEEDCRHTATPDLSNILKFVEDALNTHVWQDDKQIWMIEATKYWSTEDKTILKVFYD